MKKILVKFSVLLLAAATLLTGCATTPEYYEELSEAESAALLKQARKLALSSNRIPGHLQAVFMELPPYVRVLYDGSKHGKATFRWEIYENRQNTKQITQRDINPFWINVYAIGDLTDPQWKMFCSQEDHSQKNAAESAPPRNRRGQRVRYKR